MYANFNCFRDQFINMDNVFIRLLREMVDSNNIDMVYNLRTNLLSTIVGKPNCSFNIVSMLEKVANHLKFYSYESTFICEKCQKTTRRKRKFVDIDDLSNEKFTDFFNKINQTETCKQCTQEKKRCNNFSNVIIFDAHLVHELVDTFIEMPISTPINAIPQEFKVNGDQSFQLFALIEYIGNENVNVNSIGHYVAHVKQKNQSWQRYDDLNACAISSNVNDNINVNLLFYIRDL